MPDSNSLDGFQRMCNTNCSPSCGFHFRYPVLHGLDTFLPVSQGQWQQLPPATFSVPFAGWLAIFEPLTYWKCSDAGLDMGPAPRLGSDVTDSYYRAQSNRLFAPLRYGWRPCFEHNQAECSSRVDVSSTWANSKWIPGCRSDMSPKLSCATGSSPKGHGSECICEDLGQPQDVPNQIKTFQTGVDTCRKIEVEQGTFECLGALRQLEPGAAGAWGFRCRADEVMHPFEQKVGWPYKLPCPGKPAQGWDWCKRSTLTSSVQAWTGFGRFSPGNATTKACVRLPLRCNGVCNCMDCSDEQGCK